MRGEYHNSVVSNKPAAELPPRARRILALGIECFDTHGTTSACAENTLLGCQSRPAHRNYLRVRGEYLTGVNINMLSVELPPRARRIRLSPLPPDPRVGTTSACAENTWIGRMRSPPPWNYLRVRGEYYAAPELVTEPPELPPRARRILCGTGPWTHSSGTTSACAENTPTATGRLSLAWNYLRVRGEYQAEPWNFQRQMELPPRARRIRHIQDHCAPPIGTTSACAENTFHKHLFVHIYWNYLRVRGEYRMFANAKVPGSELPPRARRIPTSGELSIHTNGTTSACAENTN